ncbi:efflux RND transporter periplasmic adaptor subunit [Thalassotalea sp. Y01]|uniref:efflux RND transporter periplasmic adaptor subunit n=1 Tax=Thalassotalea sp. Y01 TaxID=2729613 RepID=UPI00145F5475|nr:efflux RND transporter periplasmic adaptor subunit [Thalassotalea sp. Y01]
MKSTFIHPSMLYIIGLLFLVGCEQPLEKKRVIKKVKAVQIGALSGLEKRAFPGKAKAVDEATLSFRVSGQVETLIVKSGDMVKKGDVMATLDATDYQNSVRVAQGLLAEATAANQDAARNYRRLLEIQEKEPGVISQSMVDKAQAEDAITYAAKNSAEASLQLAMDQLSYAQLLAPFDGEVVATYAEAFETIIAKQGILRLINRNSMEFEFEVPERLIGYASMVEEARVVFDVNPDASFAATVVEVGREASRSTRTYPVTLNLEDNNAIEVLPGMAGKAYIKATLPEESVYTGIDIPATALFSIGDMEQSYVWVVNEGVLEKREVEVLRPTDFGIKVARGINQGEWIVVAGVNSLSENQQVRIMDATETH